jgi:hypothetical protein
MARTELDPVLHASGSAAVADIVSITAPTVTIATTVPGDDDPATDEVQTVTIANAASGTFTLTYSGQTTSAIDYGATGAVVKAALEALSNIDASAITCTKLADVYTVTFGGNLAATNIDAMTASAAALVGPGVAINTSAIKTSRLAVRVYNSTGGSKTIVVNSGSGASAPQSDLSIAVGASEAKCFGRFDGAQWETAGQILIDTPAAFAGSIEAWQI